MTFTPPQNILVDDDLVAFGFLLVSLIFFVWGVTLIVAGYKRVEPERCLYPRWHHKRFMAYCFDFWLGWTLLLTVTGIFGWLGFVILRTPGRVNLGWALYTVVMVICTMSAAKHWARDQLPEVLQ